MDKMIKSPQSDLPRVNISLVGEEAQLLIDMQEALNKKLMMKLSIAQIVKRIVRQAAASELK